MNRVFNILKKKYYFIVVLISVHLTSAFGQQININPLKIFSNECVEIPSKLTPT